MIVENRFLQDNYFGYSGGGYFLNLGDHLMMLLLQCVAVRESSISVCHCLAISVYTLPVRNEEKRTFISSPQCLVAEA